MAALASVGDFIHVSIAIDGESTGWTEGYNLNIGSDYTLGKTQAATIATKRSRILARGHSIVSVNVSRAAVRGDGLPAGGYSKDPVLIGSEMTDPEYANTSGVGLLFRFDCGNGRYVNRLIKGIRDTWVTRNRSTIGAPTLYGVGGPYLSYSAPDTAVHLVGDYLATVRDLTFLMVHTGTGPDSWTPHSFVEWAYRRVAKHDEGRRKRISRGRQSTMA